MSSQKIPTIDILKKQYEYTIDPLDFKCTSLIKYYRFFGYFLFAFEKYALDKKIKEIKKNIHDQGDKIPKNILESYEKTLKDISDGCEKIIKKVKFDFREITQLLIPIIDDYKKNKDKPGASEIYIKVSRDIIDKEINIFIKYEKMVILYNELIFDIKKNLSN